MKSHTKNHDLESSSRAAASRKNETGLTAEALSAEGTPLQRKHQTIIDTGSYMSAQRKRLSGLKDQPLQKQTPEEEELMQGKFTSQRQELEEEELQMKHPAQLQPEEIEELIQGKLPAQRLVPEEEEEMIQGKYSAQFQPEEEEELLQGKFATELKAGQTDTAKKPALQRTKPPVANRTGIPDEVKTQVEKSLGKDFSDVTVHANSSKAQEAGALAYTQGTDIHFAPGQFKPETAEGRQLLGHELTHVIQQRTGKISPTTEVGGLPVNDDPVLEKEADDMGKKI